MRKVTTPPHPRTLVSRLDAFAALETIICIIGPRAAKFGRYIVWSVVFVFVHFSRESVVVKRWRRAQNITRYILSLANLDPQPQFLPDADGTADQHIYFFDANFVLFAGGIVRLVCPGEVDSLGVVRWTVPNEWG